MYYKSPTHTSRRIAQERAQVMDTLYDAAAEVLSSRRLTEFVNPPKALRIQSNNEEKRQRSAILVVQKMGNWGRFGLQPLRVSSQHEGEAVASLTFTTLKGGHFDGQIAITVERTKKDTLVIQIRLGIPKKGRKVTLVLSRLSYCCLRHASLLTPDGSHFHIAAE